MPCYVVHVSPNSKEHTMGYTHRHLVATRAIEIRSFERDCARWEAEHTDPNEGRIRPIKGGSEHHGQPVVSLAKNDDPWVALIPAGASADAPF
jgi:hypothetical protein